MPTTDENRAEDVLSKLKEMAKGIKLPPPEEAWPMVDFAAAHDALENGDADD